MTVYHELNCVMVWPIRETAMRLLCNCLVGALTHTLRDTVSSRVRSEASPLRNIIQLDRQPW